MIPKLLLSCVKLTIQVELELAMLYKKYLTKYTRQSIRRKYSMYLLIGSNTLYILRVLAGMLELESKDMVNDHWEHFVLVQPVCYTF